ncbi:MAG TPA: polysaccharide deacetylase family protein [Solirubrobacterales bacterium]|jgi:peptidoglycan/xylan/chitin deacetylase (PgdA/CDA1 family)|nr:polysaccharide deacetylase family protein [Solirubrobacterales bacterium]
MRRHIHRLRRLLPLWLRLALQELSPSRARRWREMPGVERVEARGQAVLTFDDGPDGSPAATAAVLDALDAAGAKATFFLVGEQMQAAPELAAEILARGHEIGVHGQRHFRHDRVPVAESVADIEAGYAAVAAATDAPPRFYRPPYGKLTPAGADACRRLGLEVAYWSTWGLDWEPLPSEHVVRRVNRDLDDGAVVLLHDSARYAVRPSAAPTAAAIAAIAARAAELGLDLVTLADACGAPTPSSARQ